MIKQKIIFSGGLGNQMFQYAFYLSLEDKGFNVCTDLSLYSFVKMHNGYELSSIFGLLNEHKKNPIINAMNILLLRILLKYKPKNIIYLSHSFREDNVCIEKKYRYLYGYWQSEMYFINIKEKVKKIFEFKRVDIANIELAEIIKSKNSVSLHIRRGDYLNNSIYSNICTDEYYDSAIRYILKNVDDPFFYIFSNDLNWTKEYLAKYSINYNIVNLNNNINSYQDMFLMSQCKHNIIANSSFSWWGAWLNNNENKIVIAPRKWMNTEPFIYEDIVPEFWIKM